MKLASHLQECVVASAYAVGHYVVRRSLQLSILHENQYHVRRGLHRGHGRQVRLRCKLLCLQRATHALLHASLKVVHNNEHKAPHDRPDFCEALPGAASAV